MKKLTIREQWMLAALPAVLTLLGYYAFSARAAAKGRENLRTQIVKQAPLPSRQAQVRAGREQLAKLAARVATQRRPAPSPEMTFDRDRALQVASQLCEKHQLALISYALDPAGKLPLALQESAGAVQSSGGTAPQIWRFELRGGYVSVMEMLEEAKDKAPLMVPLCLSMQPAPDERKPPTWILSLWL